MGRHGLVRHEAPSFWWEVQHDAHGPSRGTWDHEQLAAGDCIHVKKQGTLSGATAAREESIGIATSAVFHLAIARK